MKMRLLILSFAAMLLLLPAGEGVQAMDPVDPKSPLGLYKKEVMDMIEKTWTIKTRENQDLLGPGKFTLKFIVTPSGTVSKMEIVVDEQTPALMALVMNAIAKREYPKPPKEVLAAMPEGPDFEIDFVVRPEGQSPKPLGGATMSIDFGTDNGPFVKKEDTPLQKYKKQVGAIVAREWGAMLRQRKDELEEGTLKLTFTVDPSGVVSRIDPGAGTGAQEQLRKVGCAMLYKLELPKPSKEVLREFPYGPPIDMYLMVHP